MPLVVFFFSPNLFAFGPTSMFTYKRAYLKCQIFQ
jgi:hypothetical protein